MPSPKPRVFLVQKRGAQPGDEYRLIKGTRSQVESYVLGGLSIEPASPEVCVELGAAGVKVEDASA